MVLQVLANLELKMIGSWRSGDQRPANVLQLAKVGHEIPRDARNFPRRDDKARKWLSFLSGCILSALFSESEEQLEARGSAFHHALRAL